jgi:predicted Zn finger-like uncharacterized protein
MIISCPHCQTKYQVTYEAIGAVGRKVQCANCSGAWQQKPLPAPPKDQVESDILFDDMAEDALDEMLASEEKVVAAERELRGVTAKSTDAPAPAENRPEPARPMPNAAELKKQQAAFSRRQSDLASRLPLARLRRGARIAGAVLLVCLALVLYYGRVQIVDRYPDLAGVYEGVGLGVNVVGLDFTQLESVKTAAGGRAALTVSAQIVGLTSRPVRVPPVIVSLLDGEGRPVYEWSVSPQVPDLMAGERATFEARLTAPPIEASSVRLSFAGAGAVQGGQRTAAAAPATVSDLSAPPAQPGPAADHPN